MKTLFFFYLLSLGVFGLGGLGAGRATFPYSFNASEHNTTTKEGSGSGGAEYVAFGYEYKELYLPENPSGYRSWINWVSPIIQTMNISSGNFSPAVHHGRFEPCEKSPSVFNFSIVQEIEHFPSNLTVNGNIELIWENTLIPGLPYRDYFESGALYQFKENSYGDYRYRTVRMAERPEKKDLVIRLSLPDPKQSISLLIKEVIFASGDQCIWTYNISSEERFVRQVPAGSLSSWNITVPAKNLYHIAFAMLYNGHTVIVDYELVDRPEPIPAPPSSSYIPCLDFNLIFIFILYVLNFQK
jgi:hypothetical protein